MKVCESVYIGIGQIEDIGFEDYIAILIPQFKVIKS